MAHGYPGDVPAIYNASELTTEVKDANFSAVGARRYFVNHATPATRADATLPGTPAVGDIIEFVSGDNTGLFRVIPNTSQSIKFHGSTSATGAGGYWQAVSIYSMLRLRYVGSNIWQVADSQGQFDNDAGVRQGPTDSLKPLRVAVPVATGDAARFDTVTARTPTYAEVDNLNIPSNGTIKQGIFTPSGLPNPNNIFPQCIPGAAGTPHGVAPAAPVIIGLLDAVDGPNVTSGGAHGCAIRGYRYTVKGVVQLADTTRFNVSYALVALGVGFGTTGAAQNFDDVANLTATSRDNTAGMGIQVETDLDIVRFNHAHNDSAAAVDTTFNAAPTTKMGFEMSVETPIAADSNNDLVIIIKVQDDGGTLRTIFDGSTAPSSTDNPASTYVMPVLILNCRGRVHSLAQMVEKVA